VSQGRNVGSLKKGRTYVLKPDLNSSRTHADLGSDLFSGLS